MSVVGRVILAINQRPLEEDPPPERRAIVVACVHKLIEGPFARDGHERGAFFLGRRMEGHGKVDGARLVGHPPDARHDADSAHGYPPRAKAQTVRIEEYFDGLHDGIIVMKGFSHSHEDDVAQLAYPCGAAQGARDVYDLRHDFGRRQIAAVSHLPGGAEHAAHGAADLAADARGHTARESHEDGFNSLAVREPQEELPREAVAGVRMGFDGRASDARFRGKPRPNARGKLLKLVFGGGKTEIEETPEPVGMHRAEAPGIHERSELGSGEAVEVDRLGVQGDR